MKIIKKLLCFILFTCFLNFSYSQEMDTLLLKSFDNNELKTELNNKEVTGNKLLLSEKPLYVKTALDDSSLVAFHQNDGKCHKIVNNSIGVKQLKKGSKLLIYYGEVTIGNSDDCPSTGNIASTFIITQKSSNKEQTTSQDTENKVEYSALEEYMDVKNNFFPDKPKDNNNDYRIIVHDLYNTKVLSRTFDKKGNNKESKGSPKEVRLRRGDRVKHVFINYGGKYKGVTFTPGFDNLNLSGQAKFLEFLGLEGDDEDEKEAEKKDDGNTPTAAINNSTQEFIDDFRDESTKYVQNVKLHQPYSFHVQAEYKLAMLRVKELFNVKPEMTITILKSILKEENIGNNDIISILDNLNYLKNYITGVYPEVEIKDADTYQVNLKFRNLDDTETVWEPLTYDIMHGWKIDFSTGFVMSYLTDDKYQIIDSGTNSEMNSGEEMMEAMKRIVEGNSDEFNLGISLMAHAYTRISPYVNPVISFGFVLDNDNVTSWPIGLGLAIGREARVVISGGVILGKVQRLLPKYNVGEDVAASTLEGVNDGQLTSEVSKARPFISLTYNFLSVKKK